MWRIQNFYIIYSVYAAQNTHTMNMLKFAMIAKWPTARKALFEGLQETQNRCLMASCMRNVLAFYKGHSHVICCHHGGRVHSQTSKYIQQGMKSTDCSAESTLS